MELETQLNASDRNTRATIGTNFQKIQEEDSKDDATFEKFQKDTNTRLDNLDKQKASHDDLQAVRSELQQRINHLYAGDPRTIKTVVKEILEEKGVI